MELPPIAPSVCADLVHRTFPAPLADAITTDPDWEDTARALSKHLHHDMVDLGDLLHVYGRRLTADTAPPWEGNAASPAAWLYATLTA